MAKENEKSCIIDFGNDHISTVIAEIKPSNDDTDAIIEIIGFGHAKNMGMQRSTIVDMDELVMNIKDSIVYAEDMANCTVKEAWLCVSSPLLKSYNCYAEVEINGEHITATDIVNTMTVAKRQHLDSNDFLVRHFQHGIYINGGDDLIMSPISMLAENIVANYHFMTLPVNFMDNLEKAVCLANPRVEKTLLANLASSSFSLSEEEKYQGVCCIDIGAETTNIAIFKEEKLMFTHTLPVGGYDVTKDIATELRVSIKQAERLKLIYGTLEIKVHDLAKMINLPATEHTHAISISVRELLDIIFARYEEILLGSIAVIQQEYSADELSYILQRGLVFCGGGVQIPNFRKFAHKITKKNVRIAKFPDKLQVNDNLKTRIHSYRYQTVCGALLYVNSAQYNIDQQSDIDSIQEDNKFNKFMKRKYSFVTKVVEKYF